MPGNSITNAICASVAFKSDDPYVISERICTLASIIFFVIDTSKIYVGIHDEAKPAPCAGCKKVRASIPLPPFLTDQGRRPTANPTDGGFLNWNIDIQCCPIHHNAM
jgi:hypothetical protein